MSWSISGSCFNLQVSACVPSSGSSSFHLSHVPPFWYKLTSRFLWQLILSLLFARSALSSITADVQFDFTSSTSTVCFFTALWSWPVASFNYPFYKMSTGFITGRPGGNTTTCFAAVPELSNRCAGTSHRQTLEKWRDELLIMMGICYLHAVALLYPWALHPRIHPTSDQKHLEKIFSRKFQKQNLNLLHAGKYLHSIYVVLGIISKLEMI